MTSGSAITSADLSELVTRMDQAADAYIRGDIHRYLSLFDHSDDFTLMAPYGGETSRGFDHSERRLEETSPPVPATTQ